MTDINGAPSVIGRYVFVTWIGTWSANWQVYVDKVRLVTDVCRQTPAAEDHGASFVNITLLASSGDKEIVQASFPAFQRWVNGEEPDLKVELSNNRSGALGPHMHFLFTTVQPP